jgi:uncharacterized protein YPO0396
MTETSFVDNSAFRARNAFTLSQLDVYNWGPFDGRKGAQIDPRGTAIIGPTGSGKTTLVDALMTLLSAQPKYNLASTGGHESDRDLISYVRGFSGAGNASGDNEHIARPGKTITAISACFQQKNIEGEDQKLTIAAIFWIDGSSSSATDLKKLWIFSTSNQQQKEPLQDVYDWLELHQDSGARGLKQLAKNEAGLQVFDSKKSYLAQLKRFFEVGENAFTLLNRAAGLKQLNSIDEIFRELVLDDHSAFQRAAEVASEFDDLAEIHSELVTARKQKESLLPIGLEHNRHQTLLQEQQLKQQLLSSLPIWYAHHGNELWKFRCVKLQKLIEELEQKGSQFVSEITASASHRDNLQSLYLQVGGHNIEQLQELINSLASMLIERKKYAKDYQNLTARLHLNTQISVQALIENQAQAEVLENKNQQDIVLIDSLVLDHGVTYKQCDNEHVEIKQELAAVIASPNSNIPYKYQNFKSELAQALSVEENDIPYVAELIEVKPEQNMWRGAIERAVGGHRLRLLIPSRLMSQALNWINQRHNYLHVRLLEAQDYSQVARFLDDGFSRKLNFKSHELSSALKHFIAGIDRHCVDHSDDLQHTAHAMTEQGLMSGKAGYFEKQDQKSLTQGWMTGFNNQDRLFELGKNIEVVEEKKKEYKQQLETVQKQQSELKNTSLLLQQLATLSFENIDVASLSTLLESKKISLQALQSPESDTHKAHKTWQDTVVVHQELLDEQSHNERQLVGANKDCDSSTKQQQRYFSRIGKGLNDAQWQLTNESLTVPLESQLEDLFDIERKAIELNQNQLNKINNSARDCEVKLGKLMMKAQQVDTGALAEAGNELQDIKTYLERLQVLTEEALPEKLQRFLDYLNQSSDQGVTQLLSDIENEVAVIEERIEDLNETMRRVDFQPQRYLRLDPQRIVHESLRSLQQAQRYLRSAALENDEGESHYKALASLVVLLRDASDRKKTVAARALLDPRYRLQFAVSVVDRMNGHVIETRTGSQGGSGGEKEIIASYILTASLSYALCPDGASKPLFGTIVLDEAFSKSSQAVAGRIISALREFGLHPLFITPNKEMRLLRAHTRSAILIHRKGLSASMTSLSWQELEQQAEQRLKG